ncbi:MAG: capsid protein [Wigfec virus K19_346]|nr:MAG: capsid protein [Wigfec virus K19_346]
MAKRPNPYAWGPTGQSLQMQDQYRKPAWTKAGNFSYRPVQPRAGYDSVARSRGAQVTGEMKYYDTDSGSITITAVTTTWGAGTMADPVTSINLGSPAVANPLCLCCPLVGAALNQRIGRHIKVMKIKLTGTIQCAPQAAQNTADANSLIRLLLVQDLQTNSAQMTGAQLINDGASVTSTVCAYQNPNNFGRFRVLKEKRFTLANLNYAGSPTGNDVIQAGQMIKFKINHKFAKPVNCQFNATNGGTVADIVDNSFHVVCGASSVAMVPILNYYCRVSYKE